MKIIKEGRNLFNNVEYHDGYYKCSCEKCGCVFEIEEEETKKALNTRYVSICENSLGCRKLDTIITYTYCPNCYETVNIKEVVYNENNKRR